MITVSAVAKLMPKPPARVDNRNTNWGAFGAAMKILQNFYMMIIVKFDDIK